MRISVGPIHMSTKRGISVEGESLAKMHFALYKLFGVKREIPCGRTLQTARFGCALIPNEENAYVVNDGDTHEIRCRVCGSVQMASIYPIESVQDFFEDMDEEQMRRACNGLPAGSCLLVSKSSKK